MQHVITIEAQFGGDFQRTVGIRTLKDILKTWREQVEAQHQENKIEITVEQCDHNEADD